MSYLDRIRKCNRPDLTGYRPFRVEGREVGLVKARVADEIAAFPDVFVVDGAQITLAPGLDTPEIRTEAVNSVLRALAETGVVKNWRNELYPVAAGFAEPALFAVERAAAALFGIRAYGVHLNGFVRRRDGVRMWVGRRAEDRPVSPGKLDQIVAGGQPAGLGLMDNLIKECAEEASIPSGLARKSVPVGAVSYVLERPEGLRRDVLFNYDLELPADFTPVNTDGEIASFELMSLEQVAAIVHDSDDFKFNCSLVVIDFLIRHGVIGPEHPEYLDLQKGLRSF